MATAEQRENIIRTIHLIEDFLTGLNVENDLIRASFLGEQLNFVTLREPIIKIMDYIIKIKSLDLDDIPYNALAEYNSALDSIKNTFTELKGFSASVNNPPATRKNLILQINNLVDVIIEKATPILLINSLKNNEVTDAYSKLKQAILEVDTYKADIISKNDEIKVLLESSKSATGKLGVNVHSKLFDDESEKHNKIARQWFITTVFILAATLITSLIILNCIPADKDWNAHIIQYTITKIIVFATLFYALSICMKNYRAHKHNEVLNKHRQNALSTFETFVGSTTDEQTKNAVLLQTTMSIFANQSTGYSSSDNDGDVPSKVIEIFKSVSPTPKTT